MALPPAAGAGGSALAPSGTVMKSLPWRVLLARSPSLHRNPLPAVLAMSSGVDGSPSPTQTMSSEPELMSVFMGAPSPRPEGSAAASTLTTALLPDSPARAVAASLLPCEDWLDARRLDAEIDPRLAARPNDPVLLWLKARAFARRGDARAGLPLLSRAIQARPTSPVLALERVRLLAAVGDEPGRAAALESLRSLTDRAAWPDLIPPQPVVGGGLGNALTDHSP